MGIAEILITIVTLAVLLIIPALLITAIVLLYKIYKNSQNVYSDNTPSEK